MGKQNLPEARKERKPVKPTNILTAERNPVRMNSPLGYRMKHSPLNFHKPGHTNSYVMDQNVPASGSKNIVPSWAPVNQPSWDTFTSSSGGGGDEEVKNIDSDSTAMANAWKLFNKGYLERTTHPATGEPIDMDYNINELNTEGNEFYLKKNKDGSYTPRIIPTDDGEQRDEEFMSKLNPGQLFTPYQPEDE